MLTQSGAPGVLSAGIISYDSMKLLTTTTDFVTFSYFIGYVISVVLCFL